MKTIIVDSNSVVAALLRDGKSRLVLMNPLFNFLAPDVIIDEIHKHRDYIESKSGLDGLGFRLLLKFIFDRINVVSLEIYGPFLNTAKKIMKQDPTDAPYVACYLALRCDAIWTHDSDYKNKKEIRAVGTKDLLRLIKDEQ